MEFRAQQEHHHHQHHNSNNDQIRATSATSTLGGSFNRQQSPAAGGSRRSLLSNPTTTHNIGNNNNSSSNANTNTNTNASTLTSPNSCTTTTTTTTQTLDTNYQQVRPLQQVQLHPNNNLEAPAAAAAKPAKPGAGSSSSTTAAKYRECLKNHAASVGGSVYDGCGEFMPSGDEGSLEALRCAACSCHRNFHRKESDSAAADNQLALYSPGTRRSSTGGGGPHNPLPLLPSPTGMHHMGVTPHHYTHHGHHHSHHQRFPIVQPMSVAYGGGNESSSEELNATGDNSGPPSHHHHHSHPHGPYGSSSSSKKRFRTKFTQEQKDRMLEFAERVGWRFQKQDEDEVERFCAEVGVKRQVLKVWMHNNKSSNVKSTKNQVDHVSIMMGNMGNSTSAGTASDAIMNQHVREEDDEEGLD